MDTPANPATPLKEVYQAFFDDLAKEGNKQSTIDCYRYNILRFEKWLIDNGHPGIAGAVDGDRLRVPVLLQSGTLHERMPAQSRYRDAVNRVANGGADG